VKSRAFVRWEALSVASTTKSLFHVRTLAEGALCIALAAVLNMLSVGAPQGGRISLVMVPLVIFALRHGMAEGAIVGALFGMVDMLIEPTGIVFPLQVVLDYPLAFGLVGLVAGAFALWWRNADSRSRVSGAWVAVLATVCAGAARFAAHYVSGVVFFASFAPKGTPVWIYSLAYNGFYMLPATLATCAAVAVLMPALERALPTRATTREVAS
jgi:thiamine transporter